MRNRNGESRGGESSCQQFFVGRIYKGKEQADGDGIRPASDDARTFARSRLLARLQGPALGVQPFAEPKPPRLWNEWVRLLEQEIVKLRAGLPTYLEGVFEPRRRHKGDAPAFPLEEGVRANRGPADEFEAG